MLADSDSEIDHEFEAPKLGLGPPPNTRMPLVDTEFDAEFYATKHIDEPSLPLIGQLGTRRDLLRAGNACEFES